MSFGEEIKDKKILLIDDDECIRDALKMFFHTEGLCLDTVETAEEGIEALEKQPYDIIITACHLPGMDGIGFFKHIQALYPEVFKILMSACAISDLPAADVGLGVDAYIEKPFTTKQIKDSLARCLEKRR